MSEIYKAFNEVLGSFDHLAVTRRALIRVVSYGTSAGNKSFFDVLNYLDTIDRLGKLLRD